MGEKIRSRILLHIVRPNNIGGPKSVWDTIKKSFLNDKYEFVDLYQNEVVGKNPFKAIKLIMKFRKQINEANVDIVHVSGMQTMGILMTIAAKISKKGKIIVGVHGFTGDDLMISKTSRFIFNRILEPLTIRLIDKIYTVCEHASNNPIIKRRAKKKFAGVIYNQAPLLNYGDYSSSTFRKEISALDSDILVAIVGRVVYDKGHSYVIEAIKRIEDKNIKFIIVGDGIFSDKYREQVPKLINSGKVHLLGNRTDVPTILKGCDIFLFATLHENHSVALLEAIKMRCAVIATNVGGNPETITDNYSGILMPPRDSMAIVKSISLLAADKDKRNTFVNSALNFVEDKFSESNTIGALDELYNSILNEIANDKR